MKKTFILLLAVCASVICVRAGVVVKDSVKSEILKTNIEFNIYLPDNFDRSNSLYPVVYLLHGFGDDHTGWQVKGYMQGVADQLIRSGEAKEMIIVMPTAKITAKDGNTWIGYFNVPGWDYEDAFFSELVPAVESKYRGIGNKGSRAIMGLSMGGGGSTVYCQHHPEMFSSCYAMSAWLDNKKDPNSKNINSKDKSYLTRESVADNSALNFMKNADENSVQQLKTIAWFFDCGDDDFLLEQSYTMHMLMRKQKIKDQFTVRDGAHEWEYWHQALRIALPFASRNFYTGN